MLIYEIQGDRIPAEPEADAKRLMKKYPPQAEVIVWDGDEIIDKLLLKDLYDELTD